MNQRAHIRRPVDMPASISNADFSNRSCQVRDFCLGGMLVSLPAESKTMLDALSPGELISVSLDVQGLRGVRAVILRARVARKESLTLGLAFDAPDPSNLLAVQNHVRTLQEAEPPQGPRQPRLSREKSQAAANRIIDISRQFCLQRLEAFFPAAKEALLTAAEKASTNELQHPWFEAAKLLDQGGKALARNFVSKAILRLEQLAHGLDHDGDDVVANQQMNSRLSLVDKDMFEDWLTLKVMASRAETHFNEPLLHLQLRFDEIFAISLSARRNPVHPSVFCNAFGESLRLLPLKQKTDRIILAIFEEQVVSYLHALYADINAALAAAGVLPDIDVGRYISENYGKPSVTSDHAPEPAASASPKKTDETIADDQTSGSVVSERSGENPARPEKTTAASGATASAIIPANGSSQRKTHQPSLAARQFALQQHIAQHAYDTVRRLLSDRSLAAARHTINRQSSGSSAGTLDDGQLDAALSQLQRSLNAQSEAPLADKLQEALSSQHGTSLSLDPDSDAAVQVIHNLFAGIVTSPALSERVQAAIRRLEVPFLRLLLNDDSFLAEEQHPARQMLNRMAHLGVRGSANLQAHEKEIDLEVNAILEHFHDDVDVFQQSLKNLEVLAERQQTLYMRNMKRVTDGCEGKYKVVQARREAGQALERRIGGKRVPKAVLSLIDAGWRQLLVQTLLRGGRDSREWHEYLGVIDRMLRAVNEVPSQAELSALLTSIKSGLGQVDHTQMQNARLISELRDLLSRKARAQADPDLTDVPAEIVDDSDGHAASESVSEVEVRWRRRAQRHEAGEWFSYFDSGQEQMLRLAWTDGDKTTYVFVNHQGMKVTEHPLSEFAMHLASGQMKPIDNLDAPAVDRGLEVMVQRVYDQMAHHATHDELCGLLNRREFERRLRHQISSDSGHATLLHLDIDQFKVVNNLGGPEAGDALIREFSGLLKEAFPGALVGRLGGDEFAALLLGMPPKAALRSAETFCKTITGHRFVCAGKPFSITVSGGLVHRQEINSTAAEMMRAADSACQAAKESGRNRLQRYATDDSEMVKRDDIMGWVTRLHEAIESNRLLLRCQRIESSEKNNTSPAYEILISIAGEDGEMVAPSEFMHAAERYNRMHAVDRWVVSNVLRWMHENPERVSNIDHLSINLSGHSMNDTTLLEFLFDMFQKYPVPRERLCFEVTETAAIANLDDAADFIRELQGLGCRFSLDDFGSGLASYGHLKHLPVDYIKIDGSFIRDVANDPADLALVRSINEMGHLMGKKTIAEYVESDQIRQLMVEIGVDYVQGFAVEKPRPLESLCH